VALVASAATFSEAVLSAAAKASSNDFLLDASFTFIADFAPFSHAASPMQLLTISSHNLVYATSADFFFAASYSKSLAAFDPANVEVATS